MSLRLPLDVYFRLLDAGLTHNALVVAQLLHRQADMRRWPVVKLPIALLTRCGFTRKSVSRALQQLEQKGLVRIHRKPGKRSTVTVLWHPVRDLCFVTEEPLG